MLASMLAVSSVRSSSIVGEGQLAWIWNGFGADPDAKDIAVLCHEIGDWTRLSLHCAGSAKNVLASV